MRGMTPWFAAGHDARATDCVVDGTNAKRSAAAPGSSPAAAKRGAASVGEFNEVVEAADDDPTLTDRVLLVAARICTKMAMRIDLAGDWARFGRRAMGFREARMLNAQAVTAAMLGTSGIYLWI